MPYQIKKDGEQYCLHKENTDGTLGERVKGHCHPTRGEAETDMRALYANVEDAAAKYFKMMAVKAVGDWELDVTAIPFNVVDDDGQWFDENTDIMEQSFTQPLGFYQHGIKQGGRELEYKPVIVARAVPGSLEKRRDGWHVRYILDKTLKVAKDIMDAAYKGLVAVSSDSIAHLARLDIGGGKRIMYEKNRPGRIAVWPLAGVSIWEKGGGNFLPAAPGIMALPAMKAIYREAGLPFPEIDEQNGASQADERAQKRAKVIEKSKEILKKAKKNRRKLS